MINNKTNKTSKSGFVKKLDKKLLSLVDGNTARAARLLISDEEIAFMQDYANTVSITRLNFNDHGPVHMRKVAINAMKIAALLRDAGIKMNLEQELSCSFDDSRTAILLAAFLHDIGMSVARDNHERSSATLAMPKITHILEVVFKDSKFLQTILRSVALEGIIGHMATQRIHSLEAGTVLIADGCDMEKGRARIPMLISSHSKVGDIHKYSSSAVNNVTLSSGSIKPVRITVNMKATVGFFQVEEVLYPKISMSPLKPYIELYAGVSEQSMKCYLT